MSRRLPHLCFRCELFDEIQRSDDVVLDAVREVRQNSHIHLGAIYAVWPPCYDKPIVSSCLVEPVLNAWRTQPVPSLLCFS